MQNFNLDVDATTHDGVKVPVKITVEYPDNQGLVAYRALRHVIESDKGGIISGLAQTGDLSVLAALQESGMVLDDALDDD